MAEKSLLGCLLAHPDGRALHTHLLLFDFSEMPFLPALRMFLGTFELPDAPSFQNRILDGFADRWFSTSTQKQEFTSSAEVFAMAYLMIFLDNDLHNPKGKQRTSLEWFIESHRGTRKFGEFSDAFLTELYTTVKTQPLLPISEPEVSGCVIF